jgi:cytochrome P450
MTSLTLDWCLYSLTQAPNVQSKLQDEILTVSSDNPSLDELLGLPYLDAVVRETLRLYAPTTAVVRVAMHDDVLPVSKPYKDKHGNMRNEIR